MLRHAGNFTSLDPTQVLASSFELRVKPTDGFELRYTRFDIARISLLHRCDKCIDVRVPRVRNVACCLSHRGARASGGLKRQCRAEREKVFHRCTLGVGDERLQAGR